MSQYIVTVWTDDQKYRKYSYKVGVTDLDKYKKQLKLQYNRFTITYAGEF